MPTKEVGEDILCSHTALWHGVGGKVNEELGIKNEEWLYSLRSGQDDVKTKRKEKDPI